ncbi:MAG: phosphotransferase family protein [Chloroflexi bacterium]|nr:phosphotransferase family protein [Chloroflexota bacterium]
MDKQVADLLRRQWPDADEIVIEEFCPIPGGYSRETYRFDCRVKRSGQEQLLPMILRKDPPAAVGILHTSRRVEHDLLQAIRCHTGLPVSESYCYEMDPATFGEPAMIIQRMPGSGLTSALFNGGPDADQAEAVCTHLCELIAELHLTDYAKLNAAGALDDPRGVGIDTSSWDRYMDTTFEYYLRGYSEGDYDPLPVLMDAYLTLRRTKPRPLKLTLVHGDFNPVNFLYENGRVSALIDWENSRIGDPREDLGWMQTMDLLSNTDVLGSVKKEGGFIGYYNKLTGFNVTQEEVNYFSLFGTCNIAVPVAASMKRRTTREHMELMHLYILQPNILNALNFAKMLGYPLPEGV